MGVKIKPTSTYDKLLQAQVVSEIEKYEVLQADTEALRCAWANKRAAALAVSRCVYTYTCTR